MAEPGRRGHIEQTAQDGHGVDDMSLSPCASALCSVCTVGCLSMAVFVHIFFDYADVRAPISSEEDPWMGAFMEFVAMMALGGFLYELSIRASISMVGLDDAYQEETVFGDRLCLNLRMVIVFAVLTGTYHAMAFDMQWVHEGWLAKHYGGRQIVYSLRYVEWAVCSPILLSAFGPSQEAPGRRARNGLWRSSLLTGACCLISWQGLVTKSVFAAWLCAGWALFCYLVAACEQLCWARHLRDQGPIGRLKAALLLGLVAELGVQGVVHLLPVAGWLPTTLENKIYCIADLTFKLGPSVLIVAIYDVSTNSTMRTQAEIAAEDVRGLIDTASVPIFGVDSAGRIDQWNQKACELLGYSEEAARGRDLLDLVGSPARATLADAMEQARADKCTGCLQVSMTTRSMEQGQGSGIPATLLLSASPRRGRAGRAGKAGVVLVGCDLTQVEAYKEAEVRKARFMAIVSHELRIPLYGVIGLARLMMEEERDEHTTHQLALVKGCAERLLDLVVNIMDMATLAQTDADGQRKAMKLRHEEVEVSKLIEEAVGLARSAEDRARHPLLRPDVAIINQVRPMPTIMADKHRCAQVFFNIIANACKFTEKGKITVTSAVDPRARWVDIYVKDTGPGISPQALERIFQPFEQEDSSDCRHYDGVGLGLSIAQEVVRLHGGRIDVRSRPGAGTTFAVRLPTEAGGVLWTEEALPPAPEPGALRGGCEVEAEPEPPPPPRRAKGARRQRPLVLSVDGDIVCHAVVEGILGNSCDVHMITDGQSAIEHLEACGQDLPDVAIVNVMMPEVSGIDVCKHIREQMELSPEELPVVLVSAACSESLRAKGLESGCNSYFALPVDGKELKACVEAALQACADS